MHLDKIIFLPTLLQEIPRGKEIGRPRRQISIYNGCHNLTSGDMARIDSQSANYIGVNIARRIDTRSNLIYIGKIIGTRVVPPSKNTKSYTVWTAKFTSQYAEDDSDDEEINFSQLAAGKRLLHSYVEGGGLMPAVFHS